MFLSTRLKEKDFVPFIICFVLINALLLFTHVFFFGEFYNNFILTTLFVTLIVITAIYCGIYYYYIDKKLKTHYEEIVKSLFANDNNAPEKHQNSYYDKTYYFNKETNSIFLYEIIYIMGVLSAALSSTLFAHFYSQGYEEFLSAIFIMPLLIFLFFIPIPINIYRKYQNIQKTYTFLNIYHIFYLYLVFLMTPLVYGSLEKPNFGYTFIFVIIVFIIEIYVFTLITNKEDELIPLAKKIRN